MAKGFGAVKSAVADIERRKAAGAAKLAAAGERKLFFNVEDGSTEIVRFLEEGDEVQSAWVHRTERDERYPYGRTIPCRDQNENGERTGEECPGCDADLPRSYQGAINLIWRNAPVYATDSEGRVDKSTIVDHKDQVAVWVKGVTVFEELGGLDADYRGLSSRDFKVSRSGKNLATKYTIRPADPDGGPQEMSKADKKLAQDKYDLAFFVEPPSLETWGKTPESEDAEEKRESFPKETSVFKRRRTTA